MSEPPFRLLPFDGAFLRSTFKSGSAPLDRYIREQVGQDIRRRVAACFVALSGDDRIAGYYTLAAASLLLSELPADYARKLPRYPSVPCVRLGRLAVDQDFKGQGLGSALLADALVRSTRSEIAANAMFADAKDHQAAAFYRHHGFIPLPDNNLVLFLPLIKRGA